MLLSRTIYQTEWYRLPTFGAKPLKHHRRALRGWYSWLRRAQYHVEIITNIHTITP